jgi:hypothetical protein
VKAPDLDQRACGGWILLDGSCWKGWYAMLSQQLLATSERQQRTVQVILGVALSLVAGALVWGVPWLWGTPDLFDAAGPFLTVVGLTALLTIAGAALLRSWWALVIVPGAWAIGEMLGAAVHDSLLPGDWAQSAALWWQHFWKVTATLVPGGVVAVFLLAGVGVAFSLWLQRRR